VYGFRHPFQSQLNSHQAHTRKKPIPRIVESDMNARGTRHVVSLQPFRSLQTERAENAPPPSQQPSDQTKKREPNERKKQPNEAEQGPMHYIPFPKR
jgi:hypothetical protein